MSKEEEEKKMCMNCSFDVKKYCIKRRFPILNEDADGCSDYIRKGGIKRWRM